MDEKRNLSKLFEKKINTTCGTYDVHGPQIGDLIFFSVIDNESIFASKISSIRFSSTAIDIYINDAILIPDTYGSLKLTFIYLIDGHWKAMCSRGGKIHIINVDVEIIKYAN